MTYKGHDASSTQGGGIMSKSSKLQTPGRRRSKQHHNQEVSGVASSARKLSIGLASNNVKNKTRQYQQQQHRTAQAYEVAPVIFKQHQQKQSGKNLQTMERKKQPPGLNTTISQSPRATNGKAHSYREGKLWQNMKSKQDQGHAMQTATEASNSFDHMQPPNSNNLQTIKHHRRSDTSTGNVFVDSKLTNSSTNNKRQSMSPRQNFRSQHAGND